MFKGSWSFILLLTHSSEAKVQSSHVLWLLYANLTFAAQFSSQSETTATENHTHRRTSILRVLGLERQPTYATGTRSAYGM